MSLRLLLLLSYPALAHGAVATGSRPLMALALSVLVIVATWPRTGAHSGPRWLAFVIAEAAVLVLALLGQGLWPMAALSLALPGVVLLGFARSLRRGETPLITLMAARIHRPLPPELLGYTRHLTQLWAAIIAVLMAVEIALLLWSTPLDWSNYANGYAYLLLGGVFIIEYAYRRWRFRHLRQPALGDYLRLLLSPRAAVSSQ